MTNSFIVQIADVQKRRIVIPKDKWNEEKLKKGDYIKVTIEKVKL